MATQKTITIADISKTEVITIWQGDGGVIRFSQGYKFLDTNGVVIEALGQRSNSVEVQYNLIPTNIQSALVAIRDYMYNNALLIEEMEG